MKLHTAAAVLILFASHLPGTAQADTAPPPAHVAACGLEFDLPAGYKVTRPKRDGSPQDGASCDFDIVQARPAPPQRGECKGREDGGQPPYNVCDWMIAAGPATPSVRVVRAPPGRKPVLSAFAPGDDGRWTVSNAQAGDQPAESFIFHGKPAWRGETIVRGYWYRQRVKHFNGIYAGSFGGDVTLVQFAPSLFVELQDPPQDEGGNCTTFCASLRLGSRTQDLP